MAEKDSGKSEAAILDDLERESKEWDKDAEIDRIMKAFRLNAYAVMDLQPGVPDSDIKLTYRKKSILIHPDKTKNTIAPEAFDRLNKAYNTLLDEKEREKLDEAFADARMLIIREKKWTVDSPELKEDEFRKELLPEKTKMVLIDNEARRRRQMKAQMQEEGRQQKKEEEEMAERKRKRDYEQKWEDTREERIGSWRNFTQNKAADANKKKKKPKVLA